MGHWINKVKSWWVQCKSATIRKHTQRLQGWVPQFWIRGLLSGGQVSHWQFRSLPGLLRIPRCLRPWAGWKIRNKKREVWASSKLIYVLMCSPDVDLENSNNCRVHVICFRSFRVVDIHGEHPSRNHKYTRVVEVFWEFFSIQCGCKCIKQRMSIEVWHMIT